MKCPNCGMPIGDGAKSHECGWRKNGSAGSEAERRRAEFGSFPPCYGCAGAGITLNEDGRFKACECRRGRWMGINSMLLTEEVIPNPDPPQGYHPRIVTERERRFPEIPQGKMSPKQHRAKRAARLKKSGTLRTMTGEKTAAELLDRANQIKDSITSGR